MDIFNPHYLNYEQQVQKNKKDIADLQSKIKTAYKGNANMSPTDTTIDISNTTIPYGTTEGFLLSENGLLFQIVEIVENVVYIYFWSNLAGNVPGPQGAIGPQGPKGDPGIQGERGETGERGPRGPQGIQGIQGPQGDKGDNGNSFIVSNSVVSVDDLPSAETTDVGTAYYVGATYPRSVYVCVNYQGTKIWQNQGTLQGPQGPQGPQGIQGDQGIQGPQGVEGEQGIPGDGFNFMGQWIADNEYFKNDIVTYNNNGNISSYCLIDDQLSVSTTPPPQDPSHWLVFSAGIQGPQGATGPQGPKGDPGITQNLYRHDLILSNGDLMDDDKAFLIYRTIYNTIPSQMPANYTSLTSWLFPNKTPTTIIYFTQGSCRYNERGTMKESSYIGYNVNGVSCGTYNCITSSTTFQVSDTITQLF